MPVDITAVVDQLGSTAFRNVVYITWIEPGVAREVVRFKPYLGQMEQLELLFRGALEAEPIVGVTYGYPYMVVDPGCINREGLQALVDLVERHQDSFRAMSALAGVGIVK